MILGHGKYELKDVLKHAEWHWNLIPVVHDIVEKQEIKLISKEIWINGEIFEKGNKEKMVPWNCKHLQVFIDYKPKKSVCSYSFCFLCFFVFPLVVGFAKLAIFFFW